MLPLLVAHAKASGDLTNAVASLFSGLPSRADALLDIGRDPSWGGEADFAEGFSVREPELLSRVGVDKRLANGASISAR